MFLSHFSTDIILTKQKEFKSKKIGLFTYATALTGGVVVRFLYTRKKEFGGLPSVSANWN